MSYVVVEGVLLLVLNEVIKSDVLFECDDLVVINFFVGLFFFIIFLSLDFRNFVWVV